MASGTSIRRGAPAEDDIDEAAGVEASTDQGWTLSASTGRCHRVDQALVNCGCEPRLGLGESLPKQIPLLSDKGVELI